MNSVASMVASLVVSRVALSAVSTAVTMAVASVALLVARLVDGWAYGTAGWLVDDWGESRADLSAPRSAVWWVRSWAALSAVEKDEQKAALWAA